MTWTDQLTAVSTMLLVIVAGVIAAIEATRARRSFRFSLDRVMREWRASASMLSCRQDHLTDPVVVTNLGPLPFRRIEFRVLAVGEGGHFRFHHNRFIRQIDPCESVEIELMAPEDLACFPDREPADPVDTHWQVIFSDAQELRWVYFGMWHHLALVDEIAFDAPGKTNSDWELTEPILLEEHPSESAQFKRRKRSARRRKIWQKIKAAGPTRKAPLVETSFPAVVPRTPPS